MGKKAIFGVVGIIVIAAVVVGVVMSKDSYKHDSSPTDNSAMDMSAKSSADSSDDSSKATPVATDAVAIKDFAFSPADITVKAGTKVTWTNQDSAAHTVTQDTAGGPGMDSKGLAQGESYSATFATPGTYSYHCNFHSDMVGTVTVTE